MFKPEDGGDTFPRNVGIHLQDYTASQPRISQSIYYFMYVSMYIFLCINLLHISMDASMQIHESVNTYITISLSRRSFLTDT
jgi:hypothetical protein